MTPLPTQVADLEARYAAFNYPASAGFLFVTTA
jgi:hypothetical protein